MIFIVVFNFTCNYFSNNVIKLKKKEGFYMKKKKIIVAAFALLALFLIGGAMAFFTDTKTLTNTFTMGNVQITLTEPNYNSANATGVMPGAEINKDPLITNTGASNAYVFMKITEPCYNNKHVFDYDYATNSNVWKVVGTKGTCTGTGISTVSTVYAYAIETQVENQPVVQLAVLPPTAGDNATAPLFYQVKVNSTFDATAVTALSNSTIQIVVDAYAIQADNLPNNTKDPTTVWALFSGN